MFRWVIGVIVLRDGRAAEVSLWLAANFEIRQRLGAEVAERQAPLSTT